MTRVVAAYRETATREITQEAQDVTEARRLIEEQVPAGFEIIRLDVGKTETGSLVTGILRTTEVSYIEAEGADYEAARAALKAQLPEGCMTLGIQVAG